MGEIKLIAVDVDGTLVADDHLRIPYTNIKALMQAHDRGIINVISTGRTFKITEKEIEKIGCIDYMVSSNGAAVMELKTGEVIYKNYLDKKSIEQILNVMDKYPVVYEVYAKEGAFINKYTMDNYYKSNLPKVFLDEYITRLAMSHDIRITAMECDVEKINVNYIEEKYWDNLLSEIQNAGDFEISAGFVGNMEITAKHADKGKGLKALCDKIGIKAENVMAFGDSANDASMLKWAGMSYAMRNGNDTAKAAAKYITKRINAEGGVGETIMDYLEHCN